MKGFRDSALRAVAIVGLVAILALGAWGIIQLTLNLPTFFSGFGGNQETPAALEVPVAPVVATPQPIVPVPAQTVSTPPPPVAAPSAVPTPAPRPALYGHADLVVRILSVTPTTGDHYTAQFSIENAGTNVALRGWGFRAQLPYNPPYTFVSEGQQALAPGDRIVYTLGFTTNQTYSGYCQNASYCDLPPGSYSGTKIFSVTVDPQNLITETNKANNAASTAIGY